MRATLNALSPAVRPKLANVCRNESGGGFEFLVREARRHVGKSCRRFVGPRPCSSDQRFELDGHKSLADLRRCPLHTAETAENNLGPAAVVRQNWGS